MFGEGVLSLPSSASREFSRLGSGEFKAGEIEAEAEAEAGEELLPAGDFLASVTLLTFLVSLSSSGSWIGS